MLKKITYFSIDHPKTVIFVVLTITTMLVALALVRGIKIDEGSERSPPQKGEFAGKVTLLVDMTVTV